MRGNTFLCRNWKKNYPYYLFLSEVLILLNMEFNDMRTIIIYLRKSKFPVARISVCNVIERLVRHGIHGSTCSGTNDVISVTIAT